MRYRKTGGKQGMFGIYVPKTPECQAHWKWSMLSHPSIFPMELTALLFVFSIAQRLISAQEVETPHLVL